MRNLPPGDGKRRYYPTRTLSDDKIAVFPTPRALPILIYQKENDDKGPSGGLERDAWRRKRHIIRLGLLQMTRLLSSHSEGRANLNLSKEKRRQRAIRRSRGEKCMVEEGVLRS
ncbi:hypothetical protein CEXT_793151 [Caerostris extrusa]|uniref:Uncharacterized protein n=1 Tax=Caerostris extrusa TaxID=172846 RepID=A0AAV4V6G9_CAEEX|nr:hypothetical protein CEXT_793151 [Caerostris extrusa]